VRGEKTNFRDDSIGDGVWLPSPLPPFLPTIVKSAIRAIPEDATHRWQKKVEISQDGHQA
jgi:hypothetical protein